MLAIVFQVFVTGVAGQRISNLAQKFAVLSEVVAGCGAQVITSQEDDPEIPVVLHSLNRHTFGVSVATDENKVEGMDIEQVHRLCWLCGTGDRVSSSLQNRMPVHQHTGVAPDRKNARRPVHHSPA